MTEDEKIRKDAMDMDRARFEGIDLKTLRQRDTQEKQEEIMRAQENAEGMRAPIRRMLEAGLDCYDSVYDCPFMLRVYEQEKSKIGTITPKMKSQK